MASTPLAAPSAARPDLAATYRKIDWRLLPFLMLCYVFAYLDRINIGFAKLQMQRDLGMTDAVYGIGAGIFFLGYMLCEIPSNLLLPKIGARRTLSRIMILWGLTSASMLFVRNEHMFYGLRFLLGVFEAGFAPGMIFYLTYWYSGAKMARVMAVVMCAGPIGGIVGGPMSTWIMTAFAGSHGLAGWQWMFLIEGLPCVVLGVLALRYLDDRPQTARWLDAQEKQVLAEVLTPPSGGHGSFRQVAKDVRVYVMAVAYFCQICGLYAVSFWLPTILKSTGVTDTISIGLYSSIPYIASIVAMVVFARSSDRRRERRWHAAWSALGAAIALAVAARAGGSLSVSLISMTIATALMWASYTVFWAMPSDYLKGEAAAGGIALINTIGLLGGFVSPTLIGWVRTATGSMEMGLMSMVGLLVLGSVLFMLNRIPRPQAVA
ncbi:MFS transporter [Chitinasiproducens palmae]|uniref:Sugar phosphate permease n=1 Tax=Chitinasiproducens palmae TaxID=1770053 RepID=A0A1H2PSA9_9BURK|nr:MFS transporter [Chitinasiproducens palmae]SDV49855.1 Sugar phosphate permease [Chitinasiproducens palmae]